MNENKNAHKDIATTPRPQLAASGRQDFISFRIAQKSYTIYKMSPRTTARIMAAEERGLQWEAEAAGQEATSRGFQAMSQDTGDELNGRFTDIQGKVTDIRGYVMAMAQTGGIITAINNIATLGDRIDQMSVACYESLRFYAETLIEVREINSSTKNMDKTLARIEEGINSIKKNTESL